MGSVGKFILDENESGILNDIGGGDLDLLGPRNWMRIQGRIQIKNPVRIIFTPHEVPFVFIFSPFDFIFQL